MKSIEQIPAGLLEKIEKLLALADPANGATEEEANNASAKIQAILAKHNLDLAQLQPKDKIPEIIAYVGNYLEWLGKNDGLWVKNLLNQLGNLNGVCMVNHSRRNVPKHLDHFSLIGKKHSIEITIFMVDSIVNRVKILEKRAWNSYRGHIKRGQFRRSFFEGAMDSVIRKIEAQMNTMRDQTPEYGLMIKTDLRKSLEKMEELFTNLKTNRGGGSGSSEARELGRKEGASITLQKGVNSSNKTSTLLN